MRFMVAMFAAILPKRHWRRFEADLPVRQAAAMSGIGTFLAGMAIGIPAFLAYAQANASHAVDMMLAATGWPVRTDPGPVSVESAQAAWLAMFPSFVVFAFFTPVGILATYLVLTGAIRALSVFVDGAR